MPTRPKQPCCAHGCPDLIDPGDRYCVRHKQERGQQRRRQDGPRFYDTQQWKRIRRMMLRREPMCQAHGCNQASTEVDHIDGDVNNNAMENLVAYCKACHSLKTVMQDGGLGRERRER